MSIDDHQLTVWGDHPTTTWLFRVTTWLSGVTNTWRSEVTTSWQSPDYLGWSPDYHLMIWQSGVIVWLLPDNPYIWGDHAPLHLLQQVSYQFPLLGWFVSTSCSAWPSARRTAQSSWPGVWPGCRGLQAPPTPHCRPGSLWRGSHSHSPGPQPLSGCSELSRSALIEEESVSRFNMCRGGIREDSIFKAFVITCLNYSKISGQLLHLTMQLSNPWALWTLLGTAKLSHLHLLSPFP